MIEIQTYASPVGELILGVYQDQLCLCDWQVRTNRAAVDARVQKGLGCDYQVQPHALHQETVRQLEAFFAGDLTEFDLPIRLVGTEFQQSVWRTLQGIGYGETTSYSDLSERMGNPKAIRAIAAANGANVLSLIVPCHRVIGRDGSLVGYAGGLPAKEALLRLEGSWPRKAESGDGGLFSQPDLF